MIFPLDIGYGWTKWSGGLIPSVVGQWNPEVHDQDFLPDDVRFIEGDTKQFVGGLALRKSDVRYFATGTSKADMWTTKTLIKTALGLGARGRASSIVTGLPVDYFFNQRPAFTKLLEEVSNAEDYTLSYGRSRSLTSRPKILQHKIVPQPFGAAMDFLLDDNGQIANPQAAKKKLLVSDWGMYTWDVLVLDGMQIHTASFSRDDMGITKAYKLLQRYLREAIGRAPALELIDQAVIQGEYEGYDITPLVAEAFRAVLMQMELELNALDMNFHTVILAGGRAAEQKEGLTFHESAEVVQGSQVSNLNGYGKIGVRTWGTTDA